jgi:V/A-type H+/Na+-transporting ATPase subunit B
MSIKEYRTAVEARGGLLVMKQTPGVAFGDRVRIEDHAGVVRNGQVIRAADDEVLILVFEGVENLDLENTWVRFLDAPVEMALSPELLGREFNGLGEPRDGRPPILSSLRRPVGGSAINPAARTYPREFIQTGISTIDGLNSLVRGQKLPIFTGSGLPHNRLAAQIVRQARLKNQDAPFSIVFAAMGVSYADAKFFRDEFASSGVLRNVVMFINLADDPPVERLTLPRTALTAAEYLAYDLDRHVLVVMTDMTYYAEALREVATAKGDVPARKGYPGYLYSDLAEIYERCGRIHHRHGSITMMPVVSMPSDDITHPIPDLTGYITEGQIVLSRELDQQGIYPPVHISPSLSRLMKDGIGKDDTREDHPRVAAQLYALYARALETRNLASIIGADELSTHDRRYLTFADAFDRRFVGQGENEDRSIEATLDLAWELMSIFPKDGLTRVSEADLAKYYRELDEEQVGSLGGGPSSGVTTSVQSHSRRRKRASGSGAQPAGTA